MVIGNGGTLYIMYKFLLTSFYSNCGPVLYYFRDIASYLSKIAICSYPTCICALIGMLPVGILP